jgi:hypothetical protein
MRWLGSGGLAGRLQAAKFEVGRFCCCSIVLCCVLQRMQYWEVGQVHRRWTWNYILNFLLSKCPEGLSTHVAIAIRAGITSVREPNLGCYTGRQVVVAELVYLATRDVVGVPSVYIGTVLGSSSLVFAPIARWSFLRSANLLWWGSEPFCPSLGTAHVGPRILLVICSAHFWVISE